MPSTEELTRAKWKIAGHRATISRLRAKADRDPLDELQISECESAVAALLVAYPQFKATAAKRSSEPPSDEVAALGSLRAIRATITRFSKLLDSDPKVQAKIDGLRSREAELLLAYPTLGQAKREGDPELTADKARHNALKMAANAAAAIDAAIAKAAAFNTPTEVEMIADDEPEPSNGLVVVPTEPAHHKTRAERRSEVKASRAQQAA